LEIIVVLLFIFGALELGRLSGLDKGRRQRAEPRPAAAQLLGGVAKGPGLVPGGGGHQQHARAPDFGLRLDH